MITKPCIISGLLIVSFSLYGAQNLYTQFETALGAYNEAAALGEATQKSLKELQEVYNKADPDNKAAMLALVYDSGFSPENLGLTSPVAPKPKFGPPAAKPTGPQGPKPTAPAPRQGGQGFTMSELEQKMAESKRRRELSQVGQAPTKVKPSQPALPVAPKPAPTQPPFQMPDLHPQPRPVIPQPQQPTPVLPNVIFPKVRAQGSPEEGLLNDKLEILKNAEHIYNTLLAGGKVPADISGIRRHHWTALDEHTASSLGAKYRSGPLSRVYAVEAELDAYLKANELFGFALVGGIATGNYSFLPPTSEGLSTRLITNFDRVQCIKNTPGSIFVFIVNATVTEAYKWFPIVVYNDKGVIRYYVATRYTDLSREIDRVIKFLNDVITRDAKPAAQCGGVGASGSIGQGVGQGVGQRAGGKAPQQAASRYRRGWTKSLDELLATYGANSDVVSEALIIYLIAQEAAQKNPSLEQTAREALKKFQSIYRQATAMVQGLIRAQLPQYGITAEQLGLVAQPALK